MKVPVIMLANEQTPYEISIYFINPLRKFLIGNQGKSITKDENMQVI